MRRALTPAERAVQEAGRTVEACARFLELSPRTVREWLAANHIPVYDVACQLAAWLHCSEGVFHRQSLVREREKRR